MERSEDIERVVFVTGASGALGTALAAEAAASGATVFAAHRGRSPSPALARLAEAAPNIVPLPMDVTSPASVSRAAERVSSQVPAINLLVNCAGANLTAMRTRPGSPGNTPSGSIVDDTPTEVLEAMLAVNALGALNVVRGLLPLLVAASGTVVNVSSDRGSLAMKAVGGNYGYTMGKAALNMLTRGLGADLRPYGVVVAAVHPGWFRSRIGGERAPESPTTAASQLLRLAERLKIEHTASFLDVDGEPLPW